MIIRRVNHVDLPQCVDLIKKSFLTVAREFNITEQNAPDYTAYSISEEVLREQLASPERIMIGCFSGENIIGYFSLLLEKNRNCELNNLCVSNDYRNKGIGLELLYYSFRLAKESACDIMNISIVDENERLKKWYIANGFHYDKSIKFDFFPFTCGYLSKDLSNDVLK